jgi:hydrogen cyanide synthase HcnA
MKRANDLQELHGSRFKVTINGHCVDAVEGETVIGVLQAIDLRGFSKNDHGVTTGGYCWMGVCHNCLVKIDGLYKRRACQTVVVPGMKIETNVNRFDDMGVR